MIFIIKKQKVGAAEETLWPPSTRVLPKQNGDRAYSWVWPLGLWLDSLASWDLRNEPWGSVQRVPLTHCVLSAATRGPIPRPRQRLLSLPSPSGRPSTSLWVPQTTDWYNQNHREGLLGKAKPSEVTDGLGGWESWRQHGGLPAMGDSNPTDCSLPTTHGFHGPRPSAHGSQPSGGIFLRSQLLLRLQEDRFRGAPHGALHLSPQYLGS